MRPREVKRLEKELQDMKALSSESSVSAEAVGGNMQKWSGTLIGPDGTPYAGGYFKIDIAIPEDYPYNPPKMKFDTKIWHPNISSQTGAICLDVLGKEWSPALTIRTALLSIMAMLSAPEPDDPQDAQVADQYKQDRPAFDQTAKFWTEMYAQKQDEGGVSEAKVTELVNMGFEADKVRSALEKHKGDVNEAAEELLSGCS